jgi:hypothetical protein
MSHIGPCINLALMISKLHIVHAIVLFYLKTPTTPQKDSITERVRILLPVHFHIYVVC